MNSSKEFLIILMILCSAEKVAYLIRHSDSTIEEIERQVG